MASLVHVRIALRTFFLWFWAHKKREKGNFCKLPKSVRSHPLEVGLPTALHDANRASAVRFNRPPMSVGGAGLARSEVTRKFVVELFCGGAFHDAAFTRVDGGDVVRLCDWKLRMCARFLTRSSRRKAW